MMIGWQIEFYKTMFICGFGDRTWRIKNVEYKVSTNYAVYVTFSKCKIAPYNTDVRFVEQRKSCTKDSVNAVHHPFFSILHLYFSIFFCVNELCRNL